MKKIFVTLITTLLILFGVFVLNKSVSAQSIPTIISHQGRLLNASSQPVTTNVTVEFKIYDALTGGTQVWAETQSIAPDNLGFYDTFLGGVTALPATLPNPSYLQIKVQSETLFPRLQFGSVPFAQKAGDLDCVGCVGMSDLTDAGVTSRKMKPTVEDKLFTFSFSPCGGVPIPESTININTDTSSKLLTYVTLYAGSNTTNPNTVAVFYIEVDGVVQQPANSVALGTYPGATKYASMNLHAVTNVGIGNHTVRLWGCAAGDIGSIFLINNAARISVVAFSQ